MAPRGCPLRGVHFTIQVIGKAYLGLGIYGHFRGAVTSRGPTVYDDNLCVTVLVEFLHASATYAYSVGPSGGRD